MMAQQRLSQTVAQIRAIEANALKDPAKIRQMKKDNEVLAQQGQMKAQKGKYLLIYTIITPNTNIK